MFAVENVMHCRRLGIFVASLVAVCGFVAPRSAWAQQSDQQRIEAAKSLWDVEEMLSEHVERLTRHYHLNEQQRAQTSKLLADRVHRFLDKYDQEIWPLMLDLTELNNTSDQEVDVELVKRIGSQGYDIFLDAKKEIVQGQDVFRQYLNDDQKKIHDRDLKGLEYHFNQWDKQFQEYRKGKPSGRPLFSNVRLGPQNQPMIPRNQQPGGTVQLLTESRWENYVKRFIQEYKLDEEQKTRALAILEEFKVRADKYRVANRKDLGDAQNDLRAARRAKPFDPAALKQAQVIWDLLNQPFEDMFAQLKSKLDKIPTEKQKQDYLKRFPQRVEGSNVTPIPNTNTATPKSTTPEKTPSTPPDQGSSGGTND